MRAPPVGLVRLARSSLGGHGARGGLSRQYFYESRENRYNCARGAGALSLSNNRVCECVCDGFSHRMCVCVCDFHASVSE